jgi:kynureninase
MEKLTVEFARKMDAEDSLRGFRERFYLKDDEIYMDGNSLGLLSKDAEACLLRVLDEWKNYGINGWEKPAKPWFYYAEEMGRMQAPLFGAKPEEIIVHSSNTVNLHNMLATFFNPVEGKDKIMIDELNFPSDRYAVESHLKMRGLDPAEKLVVVKSPDGRMLDEDSIISLMADDIAFVLLPGVLYRSGQLLDMQKLTKAAHEKNIMIGFDCCHSAGSVQHEFDKWDVDFAFWCNYKYFNNGPGGTASVYINERHFGKGPGMAGWQGFVKKKMFDMVQEFEPEDTAGAWQIGTPHMLSMAPLEGSLKLFHEAGMGNLRDKSIKLTEYMMMLIDNVLAPYGFGVGTPREAARRGGHVALEHDDAIRINAALKNNGVIPDFRYPNVIRLAPIALYNSFEDVWNVVNILKNIMDTKEYEKYSSKRGDVA